MKRMMEVHELGLMEKERSGGKRGGKDCVVEVETIFCV